MIWLLAAELIITAVTHTNTHTHNIVRRHLIITWMNPNRPVRAQKELQMREECQKKKKSCGQATHKPRKDAEKRKHKEQQNCGYCAFCTYCC